MPKQDMKRERIPLSVLIRDERFLKPLWDELSVPQQVLVKAFYGLPLETQDERDAWAVLNGLCEFDALGYPTTILDCPYEPKEYHTLVGLLGRRAGKSYVMCFIILYEILFGGHFAHVDDGIPVIVVYVAQDLATAKTNMRYIRVLAQKNPRLAREIVGDHTDRIEFKNGIIVQPEPPTIKTGRGIAVPVLIMDEVAFWYKTSDNANPDYEVLNALAFSQTQFSHPKILMISTPYTEEGLLWEYWRAGTDGQFLASDDPQRAEYKDALVLTAPTAAMKNPKIKTRDTLARLQASDPQVFIRESLAKFVSSESNFIQGSVIDAVTDKGVKSRSKAEIERGSRIDPTYVAVMDPAFRNDSFAFTIGHTDAKGVVIQDFLQVWSPDKKAGLKLDPNIVMAQVGQFLHQWQIPVVYSDQFHMDTLQYIARQHNFAISEVTFSSKSKAKIYNSLEKALHAKRVRFLDIPEIRQQLSQLNKKNTALGTVQIAAPPGKKDDVATVCALLVHMAQQHMPTILVEKKEPTLFERLSGQIQRKNKEDRWAF